MSTESSDQVAEETKQQLRKEVEEKGGDFVDDEEVEDERDDLEDEDDEDGDEIDEQSKKVLENLNKSDEAANLKDIVLEK
jgi:hypothetical protein